MSVVRAGIDYTILSLGDVSAALGAIAHEAQASFGGLDGRQLNWRPDVAQWSVAQCIEHLLTANAMMLRAGKQTLADGRPRTLWQRVPVLPGVLGPVLIRSQAPANLRKYTAPQKARPATSDIAADVIPRFVEQQHDARAWVLALDETEAARAIMISPFLTCITYSVLDGCRLVVAHNHRHIEQAFRVMQRREFPTPLTV